MKKIFIYTIMACATLPAFAQSTNIADLRQDYDIMKRELGQLRLEVEQLRRENKTLSDNMKSLKTATSSNDSLNSVANSLRTEMSSKDEAVKRDVLSQVQREMESLASQTNASMKKLADAIGTRPKATAPTNFSESYPKTGTTHTVTSGDTISAIARKYNSKSKWIQDANKITDPSRDLVVGSQIFIPQEQ